MNSDHLEIKAKFGGYDKEMAEIYRQKYKTKGEKVGGYQTISKLPKAEGNHLRGGVTMG